MILASTCGLVSGFSIVSPLSREGSSGCAHATADTNSDTAQSPMNCCFTIRPFRLKGSGVNYGFPYPRRARACVSFGNQRTFLGAFDWRQNIVQLTSARLLAEGHLREHLADLQPAAE